MRDYLKSTQACIAHALERQASDIHMTPMPTGFLLRLRIQGVLQEAEEIPLETGRTLVQAFKAEGKMNIAETRRPQDARLCHHQVELRLATHPTLHGENLVIRLLNTQGKQRLNELGLAPRALGLIEHLLQFEQGLVLVAGATGSGKTTTLHAMLNTLGASAGRIATLEDPVEIINARAMQTDLSRLPHLDFASGLRSLMRQDPDTILVGEIRDEETAELTLNAALTGHRVLASIHAPDCLGALCRLVEMGLRFSSLLNCLNGVVTLRLKCAALAGHRHLQAEIINLKKMNRSAVLACKALDELIPLCTPENWQEFPS